MINEPAKGFRHNNLKVEIAARSHREKYEKVLEKKNRCGTEAGRGEWKIRCNILFRYFGFL